MKKITLLLGAVSLFFVFAAQADTFTVTSGTYGSAAGGDTPPEGTFTGSMTLSGSFTLDAPLGANLTGYDFTGMVTAYSLDNGVDTFTLANSAFVPGENTLDTDSNGEITDIQFDVATPGPSHLGVLASFMNFDWEGGPLGDVDGYDNANCIDVDADLFCIDASSIDGVVEIEDVSLTLTKSSVPPVTPPTTPPAAATPVPTMSAYGLALTMLGLLVVAGRRLRVSAKRK